MLIDHPLEDEELEWLEEQLLARVDEDAVTDGMDEGVLCIPELDGFLTAVVSGPTPLMPSRWMPALYGDFEPVWESLEDAGRFTSLLMQHSNGIVTTLTDPREVFEPLFFEREVDGRTYTIVDEWCEGYMRAVRLDEAAWRSGGKEVDELLRPIRAFTEESGWTGHDLKPFGKIEQLQRQVTPNAEAIHAYWYSRRQPGPTPMRRDGPRIGRNDPCPCGSGRKFKKCCLH